MNWLTPYEENLIKSKILSDDEFKELIEKTSNIYICSYYSFHDVFNWIQNKQLASSVKFDSYEVTIILIRGENYQIINVNLRRNKILKLKQKINENNK